MKLKTDNKIPRPSPQRPFPFPNSGSQGSIKPGGPHVGKTPLPKKPDLGQIKPGALLLLVYGLGMTAPFVVAALFARPFLGWVQRHRAALAWAEKAMGVMLILFGVLIATGGEEALELIANHPPDLVLLDVRMPGHRRL